MRVGTAEADITPPVGVDLSGFAARENPSTGVLDPLHARGLYLEEDGEKLLWLHADVLGFEHEFVQDLRQEIGLAPHQIAITATHTHSGPATLHLLGCGQMDDGYMADLRSKLIALAPQAIRETEPAEAVYGVGHSDLSVDRRGQASAHVDQRVAALGFSRPDGSYKAVLANYAIHNVSMGHDNKLISADMFGRTATKLNEALPGRPTVLMTNGPCGNINPKGEYEDPAPMRGWGDELAGTIAETLAKGEPLRGGLRSATTTLGLPIEPLDKAGVDRYADGFRKMNAFGSGGTMRRVGQATEDWYSHMSALLERNGLPATLPMEVHVIRIGAVCFVLMAAEVFSRMSDELRRATAIDDLYVVGYANGDFGYLAPEAAYDEGGYEVGSAFMFYDKPPVMRGGFELARDRAAEMVRELA